MTQQIEVQKLMHVSTKHLSPYTHSWLINKDKYPYWMNEFGAVIHVTALHGAGEDQTPPDLWLIIDNLFNLGVAFVMFDGEGQVIDGFHKYVE